MKTIFVKCKPLTLIAKEFKKEKDKMNKFKVGDRVKVIENNNSKSLKVGEIKTITGINSYWGNECVELGFGYWTDFEKIVLVSTQLTPKFNIGDRVDYFGGVDIIKDIKIVYTLEDSAFTPFEELIKKNVQEELTVEQICKELGREIKIVK